MKKKIVGIMLATVCVATLFAGCGNSSGKDAKETGVSGDVSVISREDGSGTRGAFTELTGVSKDDVDNTTDEAIVANSTEIVMTTVAGDENAIGYVSLGSLNDTVKAVSVNGVEPSAENIKNGTYALSRPFNIVTKDNLSEVAKDFVTFIMSKDGQAVVNQNGYVAVDENANSYQTANLSGKVVVSGSSSVTPVMEKLKEAYKAVNPKVDIEVQESDSTTGITDASDGNCDIGMASRDLKDSENKVTATAIAQDGIVIIVNKANSITDLSVDQIKSIFTGDTLTWDELAK